MRNKTFIAVVVCILAAAYLLLLIPEQEPFLSFSDSGSQTKQPFVWNQDSYWQTLEAQYRQLQQSGCRDIENRIASELIEAASLLLQISRKNLGPDAPEFADLERRMFETGPLVSGCNIFIPEYIRFVTDMRYVVKKQSERWDMNDNASRITLYRLLYGGRTAIEEIMLQSPKAAYPVLIKDMDAPSQTPATDIHNVKIHSGDILVSRGGALTSALIARGNDYPGNFSHIAFVYVDPGTHEAKIVESHIEIGVVVSTVEEYLKDKKLRIMLLRPRADLPQMINDPMLPHKAAEFAYRRANEEHIPYDFAMDYKDHSKLFCSEVASAAYEQFGIHLWAGISHISSPGLRKWLSAFGVRHFETQEPSDLEYDPQLVVVAEWRDQATLKKDRYDNAVTEVMLEGAEKGDELSYQWYLIPLARTVKAYSVVLNFFGRPGPVPEGMSATTALRTQYYDKKHEAIKERLSFKADQFKADHGYAPPYWELVTLARTAKDEVKKGK
ncbi:MAG: YiiX/YebB-like N1pC/P60 family cysteine hydrolase [Thermodesulfovibrionales bacterium]|nr:YiiX/YebB-like N1pC/P60 family cysteine hydrolase [Thermodesulfovibrionales bacterium]